MANEIFFDRKHNVAIVKTEQSIEDFKQSTLDEFHKLQSQTRIVKCYEDELKELKR